MTTKKSPSALDFDSWDAAAEEAAIQAAADATAIRYIIIEQDFVGRFPDGTVIRTPIRVSAELIDRVSELSGDTDPRQQLEALLDVIGHDDDLAYLRSADLLSSVDYATKYFRVFEKVMGVTLGE